ncbi:MAG TPA: hypothetical protein VLG28_14740 [Acidimicrobiia bacterium]|nr:hypothetical protein [Acidimicrobiia bacterium]
MPSDLRERIVGLVDTSAPPIDVDELAQQLAARAADPLEHAPSPAVPMRRPLLAFVGAFGGVLLLVGGALIAGVWLHQPATTDAAGFSDAVTAAESGTSGWWWIALPLVVIGIGAIALIGRQRATTRRSTEKEDAMQTLEKRTESARQPEPEKLLRQRRWLVIALAFVLVVGAVAIGWLIADNRSAESDLDAAIWPPENELSVRQQYMLDVVGPGGEYHETFNAGDFDTFYELHAPGAFQVHGNDVFPLATSREILEATTTMHAERVARTWILGEWNAAVVVEFQALPGQQLLVFTFAPSGEKPLIYSVTYFPVERDSSLLAEP